MGNLKMISTNGWQTSVAGENVIEKLFESKDWTVKQLKYIGLMVSGDAMITINDNDPFFIDYRLGIDYSTEFEPVESLTFNSSGLSYYILAGY